MSQATTQFRKTSAAPLPGLPRESLTPQQQLDALQRVQSQAEQRVKLGLQLLKAAEAHTLQHRSVLDQVKAEQEKMKAEMTRDIGATFTQYDEHLGELENDLSNSVQSLEAKIDTLQQKWAEAQQRIEGMLKRSEAMMDQTRTLLESGTSRTTRNLGFGTPASAPPPAPIPFPAAAQRPATPLEAEPEAGVSEGDANDEMDSLDPQSHLDLKIAAADAAPPADTKLKLTESEPPADESPEQVSSIFRAALAKMRKPDPLDS